MAGQPDAKYSHRLALIRLRPAGLAWSLCEEAWHGLCRPVRCACWLALAVMPLPGPSANGVSPSFSLISAATFPPVNPVLIGQWPGFTPGNALAVWIEATNAFVAQGNSGVGIFDISRPTVPEPIGGIDTPGSANGLFIISNLLWVADGFSGLEVYDLTDLKRPIQKGA